MSDLQQKIGIFTKNQQENLFICVLTNYTKGQNFLKLESDQAQL
jgi:hypothetical protein